MCLKKENSFYSPKMILLVEAKYKTFNPVFRSLLFFCAHFCIIYPQPAYFFIKKKT